MTVIKTCKIHGDLTIEQVYKNKPAKESHNIFYRCKQCRNRPEQQAKTRAYYSKNKEHICAQHREYYKNPEVKERYRERKRIEREDRKLRNYEMTLEQYNEKLKEQNYVCEICKKPEISYDKRHAKMRKLSIDHCHKTLKNRGLLCNKCNLSLGRMDENIESLTAMINYIIKYR
jgi:hypothetical protein